MKPKQADLFAPPQADLFDAAKPAFSDAIVQATRARFARYLALVKGASEWPWTDQMGQVLIDGDVERNKDVLPPDEFAAFMAEFDPEMERLYVIYRKSENIRRGYGPGPWPEDDDQVSPAA